MPPKQFSSFILKALCALVVFARLYGQSGQVSGTIRGLVTDSSGGPVTGAAVQAVNLETGFERRATSGSDGVYEVPLLPIGSYKLIVNATGFDQFDQSGVSVRLDNASTVDVALRVGSSKQTVTVEGDASILNTQTFDVGGGLNQLSMENMPITSRNTFNLALLAPGF
ncbi:MAG: carboxypeptidase regulatory-like domain-containing protein, partial [Acidobacteriaceae bacterium]|nr:carboxypeptidase regulatory-like domain-containing protein [Acidobacteriaceae bacterium]